MVQIFFRVVFRIIVFFILSLTFLLVAYKEISNILFWFFSALIIGIGSEWENLNKSSS